MNYNHWQKLSQCEEPELILDYLQTLEDQDVILEIDESNLNAIARKRIENEIQEVAELGDQDFCIFRIQGKQSIFEHAYVVVIQGQPNTPYQGGYFPFLLQYPNNYPFKPPKFYSLYFKHPHIYPDQRVCLPIIDYDNLLHEASLYRLIKSAQHVIHRQPNPISIANQQIYNSYTENFIRQQAKFFSKERLEKHFKCDFELKICTAEIQEGQQQ